MAHQDVLRCKPAPCPSREGVAHPSWARRIAKVYQADPLVCTRCGQRMNLIAFVTDQMAIGKTLDPLGLSTPEGGTRDDVTPRQLVGADVDRMIGSPAFRHDGKSPLIGRAPCAACPPSGR